MYSVTDRTSYEKVSALYQHILKVKEAVAVPCVLVGNKSDLDPDDRVSEVEGQMIAQKLKLPFYETSAKSRENVDEAYAALIRRMRQLTPKEKQALKKPIDPKIKAPEKKPNERKRGGTISNLLKKIGGKA